MSPVCNLKKVPFKLKTAYWDIFMFSKACLQIRNKALSVLFENAIRYMKNTCQTQKNFPQNDEVMNNHLQRHDSKMA